MADIWDSCLFFIFLGNFEVCNLSEEYSLYHWFSYWPSLRFCPEYIQGHLSNLLGNKSSRNCFNWLFILLFLCFSFYFNSKPLYFVSPLLFSTISFWSLFLCFWSICLWNFQQGFLSSPFFSFPHLFLSPSPLPSLQALHVKMTICRIKLGY